MIALQYSCVYFVYLFWKIILYKKCWISVQCKVILKTVLYTFFHQSCLHYIAKLLNSEVWLQIFKKWWKKDSYSFFNELLWQCYQFYFLAIQWLTLFYFIWTTCYDNDCFFTFFCFSKTSLWMFFMHYKLNFEHSSSKRGLCFKFLNKRWILVV